MASQESVKHRESNQRVDGRYQQLLYTLTRYEPLGISRCFFLYVTLSLALHLSLLSATLLYQYDTEQTSEEYVHELRQKGFRLRYNVPALFLSAGPLT